MEKVIIGTGRQEAETFYFLEDLNKEKDSFREIFKSDKSIISPSQMNEIIEIMKNVESWFNEKKDVVDNTKDEKVKKLEKEIEAEEN